MTNTRNTPVEALESELPVRVTRYAVRRGSGGRGGKRGGDGVVRELEFLAPVDVSVLSDRRRTPPWGLAGGGAGARGRNVVVLRGTRPGAKGAREIEMPGKFSYHLGPGDRVRIETPGGGGFGRAPRGTQGKAGRRTR
jgi:N-methylhydantoinase B